MSGIKISALPAATSAQLTDIFPASQLPGPVTRKVTLQQVATLIGSSGVQSVTGTANQVQVNNTDPLNPILLLPSVLNVPGTFAIQGTTAVSAIINDNTMATALATNLPTALSVKTYVDNSTSGKVTSVSGTANRITSTGGTTPVIDISAAYIGQTSITTLGTITTGIWNGTQIDLANYVSGNLAVSHLNSGTGATSSTFWRGDGTWASAGSTVTPAALTAANDTNVTLTLGGTPATALLQASSITAGWTGTLSGTRGGTGVNNGASTFTMGGSHTLSGAFTSTFTFTGTTSVTFPTSGTLATTANTVSSITGTANQVIASASTGAVTLSLPQSIATSSAVQFASVQFSGNNGLIDSNGKNIFSLSPTASAVNNVQVANAATTMAPTLQATGSDTNISLNLQGKGTGGVGMKGISDGTSASTGYVGEFVSSIVTSGSPVSLTSATPANVTSISLTAGDWDVWGIIGVGGTANASSAFQGSISTSSATIVNTFADGTSYSLFSPALNFLTFGNDVFALPAARITISATTTVYMCVQLTFTGGTGNGFGALRARRVR